MTVELLCSNCGSSFQASEPRKEWDPLSKQWVELHDEICSDCKKDLGIEDEE